MDARFSNKEKRAQPSGIEYVYVDSVFDMYPILDGDSITGIETVDGKEEIIQSGLFASIKQRGSDPLAPAVGNRWAELLLGEVAVDAIVADIRENVAASSAFCTVVFSTAVGEDGKEYLSYKIKAIA